MEVKTIECSPKDTIIIQFNIIEDYTIEDISRCFENLQSAISNPIVFVPKGVIEEVTVVSSEPRYLGFGSNCGIPAPEIAYLNQEVRRNDSIY